jgi:DNA-directed RNA polymerase specialized sigma24 family protein
MLNANAVAQHLPFLRRYARTVTGTQTSGDAYVAAVLEAIVEDPKLLDSTDLRVTLYRLFSTIWASVSINEDADSVANLVAAERNLGQLTPKPRQAFLLISMEGFSEHQAAHILDVSLPVLRELVEEAGRELAVQIATDVLIALPASNGVSLGQSSAFLRAQGI